MFVALWLYIGFAFGMEPHACDARSRDLAPILVPADFDSARDWLVPREGSGVAVFTAHGVIDLSESTLEEWEIDAASALEIAIENARHLYPNPRFQSVSPGVYMVKSTTPTWVLVRRPWLLRRLGLEGDPVVFARGNTFVTGAEDVAGLEHVGSLSVGAKRSRAFRLTEDGDWEPFSLPIKVSLTRDLRRYAPATSLD